MKKIPFLFIPVRFLHVPQSKKVHLFGIFLLAPQFGQTTSCLLNATYKNLVLYRIKESRKTSQ